MSITSLFLKIDLFSQIFSFQCGKLERKNRTFFGAILSTIIIILCAIYLGQLLDLYFGNKLLPKIISTTQTIQFTERQSSNFVKSPILFILLFNGYPLEQFEAMTGKKYMNVDIYFNQYSTNFTKQYVLPQIDCGKVYPNQTFDGYRCIDFSSIDSDKKSLIFSGNFQTTYEIHFSSCQGEANCAPEQETLKYLTQYNSSLFAHLVTSQFNYTTREFQENINFQQFSFDDSLVFLSQISMQKTTSTIQQGFMLQDSSKQDHISSIHRLDTQYSRNNIKSKINFDGYGFLFIYLDQNYNQIAYQFPMITEVLSQFVCVFNIFVVFGSFASAFSRYQIVEKLSGVYLKEYFKGTAAYLIQKEQTQSPNIDLSNSYAEDVFKIQEQIKNADFQQNIHKACNINILQRLRSMILRIIGLEKQNKEEQDIKKSIYQKIIDYTFQQMDIFQIYKQLIQLNIAIKLILTKEQYATLKYCGCNLDESLEILDQNDKINKKNILQQTLQSQIQNLNHSIKQDISQSNTNQLSKMRLSYSAQKTNINNSPMRADNTLDIDSQLMLFDKRQEIILTKEKSFDKQSKIQRLESISTNAQHQKSDLILTQPSIFLNQERNIATVKKNQSTKDLLCQKIQQQKSFILSKEENLDKKVVSNDASHQTSKENHAGKNLLILSKLNAMKNMITQEKEFLQQKDNISQYCSMNNSVIKSNFLDSQQNSKILKPQGDIEIEINEAVFQHQTNTPQQKQSSIRQNLQFQENEDSEACQSYFSKQINHIEELNKLDYDEKLQKLELYNFLNKFQNNFKSISYIDKNIYNSLIINKKISNLF